MEEHDLLKERLQAITEKHRIQENIRQKKLELDQEKLELHRLKKKVLREQWLLQDSASHNAAHSTQLQRLLCDQQQTRALQLNIHRTEMEVQGLEREESMISVNESFILNRLRTVEKSSEDIIKEAQDNFVPYQLQVAKVIQEVCRPPSPRTSVQSEANLSARTMFAMEINVSKNLLTGESKVLTTANFPPEDIEQHAGLKVFDDGRKCVYTFPPPEGSNELSATEVEELLRCATLHRQVNRLNHRNLTRREEEPRNYDRREEGEEVTGYAVGKGGSRCGDNLLRRGSQERDPGCRNTRQADHRRDDRKHQRKPSEAHGPRNSQGHHYSNHDVRQHASFQGEARPSAKSCEPGLPHTIRSMVTASRSSGYPSPRSHDHRLVTASQQQLRYTPAQYIPYADYVSVDEGQLYCHSLATHPPQNDHYNASPRGSSHCKRAPSPLCGDDTHYTILSAMDTSEPITAIFMGFQTTLDDSGHFQESDGSLKAELVIIDDDQGGWESAGAQDMKGLGAGAGGGLANGKGAGRGRTGPGMRKIQKKHKACCSVC